MTLDANMDPARREKLTLDALDAMEAVSGEDWTPADALSIIDPDDLVAGLVLVATMYEAMLMVARGVPLDAVRDTVRMTAGAHRRKAS